MLLAVDIGNSNIKFGIFDSEHLLSKFSIPTNSALSANELKALIGDNLLLTASIVCSVVPEIDLSLKDSLYHAFGIETLVITNDLDLGLKIKYQPLAAIGTDRLVNSFAAVEKYGAPCIVCSFGTATTFDIVDQNRELRGGVIAPGMKTMAEALHLKTAKLPDTEIEKPKSVIGNTTLTSIQSGIFYGQIAMAEGMIERIKKVIGENPKVIASGGFASLIAENTDCIDTVDENLLLDGLRLLHKRINN